MYKICKGIPRCTIVLRLVSVLMGHWSIDGANGFCDLWHMFKHKF